MKMTKDMKVVAKKIATLQKKGKSSCKCCKGQHAVEVNLPTARSRWIKGAIDLGLFVVVPCHECHPKYFERYMTGIQKVRSDVFMNKDRLTEHLSGL